MTITLVEDARTESNHKEIADIFNHYFANVVPSLEIPAFQNIIDQLLENISQPTLSNNVNILVLQQ